MQTRRLVANLFPEPSFQARYLCFLALALVGCIAPLGGGLYYFLRQNYLLLVKYGGLDPKVVLVLKSEFLFLARCVLALTLLVLVSVLLVGAALLHRVAGVVYAIRRTCDEIAAGGEAQLKIRRQDEFQALCSSFNRMVENLKRRAA